MAQSHRPNRPAMGRTRKSFGIAAILLAFWVPGAMAQKAQIVSVPFPEGFIGDVGTSKNKTDNIKNFSTLDVDVAYFRQVSDTGIYTAQGNDIPGVMRIITTSGEVIDVEGAINWRETAKGQLHHFGFIPTPGSPSYTLTYSGGSYLLRSETDTDKGSNYGLRTVGSDLVHADGDSVSGNAANGLLDELNAYLQEVRANSAKITAPDSSTGNVYEATLADNEQALGTWTADRDVAWAIVGGADESKFSIDRAGALRLLASQTAASPNDANGDSTYEVVIQATDAQNYASTQTIYATVGSTDTTAPVLTGPDSQRGATATVAVAENTTAVGTYAADESVDWTLTGADAAKFAIGTDGTLAFKAAPDFEANGSAAGDNAYKLTVIGTDAAGNESRQDLTVNVSDVDETPADTTAPVLTGPDSQTGATATVAVAENSTAVGIYAADESVSWTLDGADAGKFAIGTDGRLAFRDAPDFEARASAAGDNAYKLTVIGTDAAGNGSRQDLTVNVGDVDEAAPADTTAPVLTGPDSQTGVTATVAIAENTTAVGTYAADESVSWTLTGADAAKFAIAADGTLAFRDAPDFEANGSAAGDNAYKLTVIGTDAAGNESPQDLTVNVGDVDEAVPVLTGPDSQTGATATVAIAENSTAVGTYAADESVDWTLTGADAAKFAIGTDGRLAFKAAPDFEANGSAAGDNAYKLTVTGTDAAGNESPQDLTVNVGDVDEAAPVLTGPDSQTGATATVAIAENSTAVGTYAADESVSWTLTGADAAKFAIGTDGSLAFRAAPDFEAKASAAGDNAYQVTVIGTDAAGNAARQELTVNVGDVDETPADTTAPALTGPDSQTGATATVAIAENTTAVGTYAADESVSWTLTGADAAKFAIAADGSLAFKAAPDFEANGSAAGDNAYKLTVTGTDAAGNAARQELTVNVSDVDETPADTTAPALTGPDSQTGATATVAIAENSTAVGTYAADESVSWTLTGADAAKFAIGTDGSLAFRAAPDFEAKASAAGDNAYKLTVTGTDAAGNESRQELTVNVGDVDEAAPVLTGPNNQTGATATVAIAENTTAVAAYTADESVSWTLTGADAAKFAIAADGSLAFRDAPDFEAKASAARDNAYKLTVTGTDAAGNAARQELTVNVSDVHETLVLAAGGPVSLRADGRDGASGLDGLLQAARIDGRAARSGELRFTMRDGAATANGRITLDAQGRVAVAAGTPAGRYPLPYRFCEVADPDNCIEGTAEIVIAAARLTLTDDAPAAPLQGRDGGKVAAVLANDRIGGAPAKAEDLKLSLVASPLKGLSLDAAGVLRLAAGTAAGDYAVTYRACEALNPGNCAQAVVRFAVAAAEVTAGSDDFSDRPIYGVSGGRSVSVIGNDRLGGAPVVASDAVFSITDDAGLPGLGIDAEGRITVPRFSEPGLYDVGYGVCEALNPANCIEGRARIRIAPIASVAGTVFDDIDHDGRFDPGRDRGVGAGYRVRVVDAEGTPQPIFDADGEAVEFVTTDADGSYKLFVDSGSGYRVVMNNPAGDPLGGFGIGDLEPGEALEQQNLAIDPSGVIYDSVTRAPIAGVTVRLVDTAGAPLPRRCLVDPAQQAQVTGADGFYRFDLVPDAAPQCPITETEYRITMDLPGGFHAGASTRISAASEAPFDATACAGDPIPGGDCEISASVNPPAAGEAARYFMSFLLEAGDPNVVNNHIAVDAALGDPALDFAALSEEATRGTALPFRIVAREVEYDRIDVEDLLPKGFVYSEGSALVNGRAQEPKVDGRLLRFAGLTPDADGEIEITLSIVAAGGIGDGRHVSMAVLRDPDDGTVLARANAALILVPERVFDCADVVGRVFEDRDGDGHADADEPGLGGMVLRAPGGETVLTDAHGRFSVPCAMLPRAGIGSNMQLKLDERALPEGWIPSTPNPQVTRLTRGKMARMDFGVQPGRKAVLQLTDAAFGADGQLRPEWQDGMRELIAALAEGPTRLGLVYLDPARTEIARARLDAISDAISRHHASGASRQPLVLETLIRGDAR
ncbi:hypothetical protein T8T21_15450 [Limimaricola variabilis]|uniref:hypothetical protein n=1 Tax=Limimaricola variabilis TaxID=1492771 RepID=UPI002AC92919|nr:hypothetical protein [Limimaricola variabilis]WPY94480.1 hypothetical protein T8T21_15450 [Limimaricola variabilis]